jgi:hypothetical protein
MKEFVIYHKSTSDEGTLTMMCGRDEEPRPSAAAHCKIAMTCASCKAMDTQCR